MSGTSADGIDAAVMEVGDDGGSIAWRLLGHSSWPWPAELRRAILDACRADAPVQAVTSLNFRLGEEFAQAAIAAASIAGIPLAEVAAIASHGQTIWHQPVPAGTGIADGAGTLQIGEPAVIAARTGCVVVADFRCADMAVGGQGAPLVPFADYLLFSDRAENRAIQNLGGIANVTFLRAGGGESEIIAFDTGPGNMVMDALAWRVTQGAERFDRDGAIAASGRPNAVLLNELLQHPYFAAPPPKTTGREQFGSAYADLVYAMAREHGLSDSDLLATATELTAETIVRAYRDHLPPQYPINAVVLGGGGTRNAALVARLCAHLAPARVVTHSDFGLPNEAKEAAAFALLGYQTLRGRPSNIPSATGAMRAAVLGKIALPPR
jgi:anhydro-N-acetylmuramic acid kinase